MDAVEELLHFCGHDVTMKRLLSEIMRLSDDSEKSEDFSSRAFRLFPSYSRLSRVNGVLTVTLIARTEANYFREKLVEDDDFSSRGLDLTCRNLFPENSAFGVSICEKRRRNRPRESRLALPLSRNPGAAVRPRWQRRAKAGGSLCRAPAGGPRACRRRVTVRPFAPRPSDDHQITPVITSTRSPWHAPPHCYHSLACALQHQHYYDVCAPPPALRTFSTAPHGAARARPGSSAAPSSTAAPARSGAEYYSAFNASAGPTRPGSSLPLNADYPFQAPEANHP